MEEIKRVKDPAKLLIKTGLLFEINRRVLHPFGLAMEVIVVDKAEEFKEELADIEAQIAYCKMVSDTAILKQMVDRHRAMNKMLLEFLELKKQSWCGRIGGIWDYRDDPEGMLFQEETFQTGVEKFDKFLKGFGNKKIQQRKKVLGFVLQGEENTKLYRYPCKNREQDHFRKCEGCGDEATKEDCDGVSLCQECYDEMKNFFNL